MPEFALLQALRVTWRDLLEIAVVAFLLYRLLLLIRGTRALQMFGGMGVLALVFAVARLFDLSMITYLLSVVFTYGAFALLVIFQPELRAALANLGPARMARVFQRLEGGEVLDEVVDAIERLSRSGVGAIIVLEREVPLGEYVESGTALDAKVSADLLTTIFTPYSPLHDGAVIVRGDVIIGASCILPLSQSVTLERSLGTRHRAAVGLTEESDALVVVVSEERASISVAMGGLLQTDLTPLQVRDLLSGKEPRASSEYAAPTVARGS